MLNRFEVLEELNHLRSISMPGEFESAVEEFDFGNRGMSVDEELEDVLDRVSEGSRDEIRRCRDLIYDLVDVSVYTPDYDIEVNL